MTTDYYYLHTNGELIHKPSSCDESDFRDSDMVVHYWRLDNQDRESAWTFLVEALSKPTTKKERVIELATKWGCNDNDAQVYAERIGLRLFRDGNQWCATEKNFVNLQDSPAGFGDTCLEAMAMLAKGLPQGFLGVARSRATKELKLIARIDALQAENKRLRGLCVECRTQLSTTLTLAMLLLPFADEKITDETYNQCVAELQKSRELLDSASKETI